MIPYLLNLVLWWCFLGVLIR
ncbi:hypothetical protein Golob_025575 [Gossypium lobatum]|uniref:Uncharacterized protein n=1 Tax=Gossypium lobatum TaxID=34289 RepID=A0A7J8LSF0_9ROSI|nr:hypothetical protein [Gossypium lobatum]